MNIPTAEELYRDTKINPNLDLFSDDVKHLVELMIEFAKLHVEAALKAASEKARMSEQNADNGAENIVALTDEVYKFNETYHNSYFRINKDSILKSYPLKNIK
jgi:hypothetical protein